MRKSVLCISLLPALLLASSLCSLAQNQTGTKQLTLNGVTPPVIANTALKSFRVGVAYSDTLTVQAGTGIAPFTWAITSGTLPPGLSLTPSTGVISGTATALCSPNPCVLTITVTDSASTVATIKLQWQASPTKTVASYDVLRDTVTPPSTVVATTDAVSLVATDRQPKGSGTYYYAVRAVDASGLKSALSNIVAVVP